jgi:hypothetical protein
VTDVIVNQRLFGVFDRPLDSLQLLSDLRTWPALLDHVDDLLQVTASTLETLDDRRMIALVHDLLPSS